ncbi:MAG: hypothetical protein ABI836_05540 [Gemmatimonadota bacterium]
MILLPGPGQVHLPGALPIQALQDSAAGVAAGQAQALDTVAAHPSFSDPVITVVQFIFQQSPLVMWGGVVLAAIVAALLLRLLWHRRHAIGLWLHTRSTAVRVSLAALVLVVLLGASATGYRTYDFVQRDNRFCSGCHIFVTSGQVMVRPDSGDYTLVNRLEGKHDTLSCHACHALKPFKEAVKMVWWMSGTRDENIPPHAKVPREVCANCHIRGEAKAKWQEIATTAGHRVHLESDSSALKDVQCVTCHALEVHRFVPVDSTCSQRGCHTDTRIQLGKMAGQSGLHCTVCHDFTAEVPRLATRDSAAGTLVPTLAKCSSCHQMKALLVEFDPARDPHSGTCGDCHDPHRQKTPAEARLTCASAGCHATWRDNAFHGGPNHRRVAQQCTLCHIPHRARVDASDCAGCHLRVRGSPGVRQDLPLPFDTTAAKQRASAPPPELRPPRGKGDVGESATGPPVMPPPAPADSFSHQRHIAINCIACHGTRAGQGRLTFEPPRGCQICHHQAAASSNCRQCHGENETAAALTSHVVVRVPGQAAREREVGFRHETHASLRCVECHTQPVNLEPDSVVTACTSCHEQHHEADRDCAACHRTTQLIVAHQRPVDAHVRCDACHTPRIVARLVPTRSLCLTCHGDQDHYAPRECTVCHLQSTPEAYRAHLSGAGT